LRLESKADRLAVALEDPAPEAAPREVSSFPYPKLNIMRLTIVPEFAHGKVDPHEAGKKGGNS
jgi:hypothetical protein